VPEFVSDEDAIKRLEVLMRKIEGSPLLLVLDDVWPGSEALVEKFKFQMSDYKILVISRIAFPKFSTQFILKPLAHEDAMTLFRHHALLEESSSKCSLSIPNEEIVQKVRNLYFLAHGCVICNFPSCLKSFTSSLEVGISR